MLLPNVNYDADHIYLTTILKYGTVCHHQLDLCRSCYARRPRMTRKRSHQDFMDLNVEEPLSPILRPPRQSMHSDDSGSDGEQVMGTGIASPGSQVEHASEWALLDDESGAFSRCPEPGPNSLGPASNCPAEAESAPTWGQVLGNLKSWGITPGSQSAVASPVAGRAHMGLSVPSLDSEHADSGAEASKIGAGAFLSRPMSAGATLEASRVDPHSAAAKQQSDRLSSSLDISQVCVQALRASCSVLFTFCIVHGLHCQPPAQFMVCTGHNLQRHGLHCSPSVQYMICAAYTVCIANSLHTTHMSNCMRDSLVNHTSLQLYCRCLSSSPVISRICCSLHIYMCQTKCRQHCTAAKDSALCPPCEQQLQRELWESGLAVQSVCLVASHLAIHMSHEQPCKLQVGPSGAEGGWGLGRVTGWGQRAGQTTKAVGDRVGQSGKTAYRCCSIFFSFSFNSCCFKTAYRRCSIVLLDGAPVMYTLTRSTVLPGYNDVSPYSALASSATNFCPCCRLSSRGVCVGCNGKRRRRRLGRCIRS